jgi:hypothetical protein
MLSITQQPGWFEKQNMHWLVLALAVVFQNTAELKFMKYDVAMATPDKEKWEETVITKHENMLKYKVFEEVPEMEVPNKV